MKPADLHNVTLRHAERLNCSVNGNPRFRCTFDDGTNLYVHLTQSDAACNYEVTNYLRGPNVNVWLSRAGRVTYLAPVITS